MIPAVQPSCGRNRSRKLKNQQKRRSCSEQEARGFHWFSTSWCPPSYKLVYTPHLTIDISTINHSYWSYNSTIPTFAKLETFWWPLRRDISRPSVPVRRASNGGRPCIYWASWSSEAGPNFVYGNIWCIKWTWYMDLLWMCSGCI
jgi:hypothetical protein